MHIRDWSSDVWSSDHQRQGVRNGDEAGEKHRRQGELNADDQGVDEGPVFPDATVPAQGKAIDRKGGIFLRVEGYGHRDDDRRHDEQEEDDHVAEQADELRPARDGRSEEHTYELQSLMRTSYDVFGLKKKKKKEQSKHRI